MVATGYAAGTGDHDHNGEYAEPAHGHAEADVTGLTAALAGKSSTSHNHTGTYATAAHNHDASYSPTGHDHAGTYSPAAHNHDASYSASGHNHTGVYATSGHNHDAAYSASGHNHAEADVTGLTAALAGKSSTSHNHDAAYSASGHNHDAAYSASGHNHDAAYSATGHSHLGNDAAVTILATATAFHGSPRVYDRGDGWITMDGGIVATGTNAAGVSLVQIPSGYRPAVEKQFTMRHTSTSASTGTITLNASTGNITYSSAFSGTAEMDFTGLQWRKA